jgi:hypothetical protein
MSDGATAPDRFGYFAPPAPTQTMPPPPPPPPPPPYDRFSGSAATAPGGRPSMAGMDAVEQDLLRNAGARAPYQPGIRPGHYPLSQRMSFLERISAGIDLAKTCFSVLRDEPALLLVPVLMLAVSAVVIVPLLLLGGGPADPQLNEVLAAIQAAGVGAVLSVVGCVGSAVIVSAATTRLEGLRPDLKASWAAVLPKVPQLAGLGLLLAAERAATRALRGNAVGRLVAGLIDRAWDFASLMAVPAILFEGVGPLRSVKRSAELVRGRWGSQLTARAVLHLGVLVLAIPLLVVMVVLGAWYSPAAALVMFCVWLVLVVSAATALNAILSAAMYRFAITGLVVPGFREADMWRAFGHG